MSRDNENASGYSTRTASRYDRVHGDIFNDTEQQRLRQALTSAIEAVQTGSGTLRALDYGSGSGNVVRHLLALGLRTTATDVTEAFLKILDEKFAGEDRLDTRRINGADLAEFDSGTYDLVTTYSVLHHVPDYLAIIREMCRVLKPGGILYIDHEVNENYYQRPPAYREFLRRAKPRCDWRRYGRLITDPRGYIHILRRLFNPRYKREGDIHVWPDDHIEWDRIEAVVMEAGLDVVHQEDYLLCRNIYAPEVYEAYKDRCTDERLLVARKKALADGKDPS
jgi:ubiquinone/menaquinone biosynthesis C-methylase UbiE